MRTRTPVALYILNQKRANLRDLERRFGVAIAVEADDTLTGANYHAIERGEPAVGVKSEVEPPKSLADDFATIVEEPAPVEEDPEEIPEAPSQVGQEVSHVSDPAGGPSLDESDVGRRRRRRRRRRGGERSFGENLPQDAPQPTDDGLAVVAEIGGDLQAPSGEVNAFDRRGPRTEEDRDRRSRRSRGQRNRSSQRPDGDTMRETRAPSFDAPPSLALEEEFAASEADYSQAPPPPSDAASAREATAKPARTSAHEDGIEPAPVAAAQEHDVEEPAPVTGAAPTLALLRPRRPTPSLSQPRRPLRQRTNRRVRAAAAGGSGRARALSANSPIRVACESRVSAGAFRGAAVKALAPSLWRLFPS